MEVNAKEFARKLSAWTKLVQEGQASAAITEIEEEMASIDRDGAELQLWRFGQLWQTLLYAKEKLSGEEAVAGYRQYVEFLEKERTHMAHSLVLYSSILAIWEIQIGNVEEGRNAVHRALGAAAETNGDIKFLADAILALNQSKKEGPE